MTNNRLVAISIVVLSLLTGFFLEHVLAAGLGLFSATQPMTSTLFGMPLGPGDPYPISWSTVLGLGIAAAAGFWTWAAARPHEVSLEIAAELRKVTWPSLAETRAATIAVIVASLIAAVLLGMFDVFWQFLTDKIQNPTL